MSTYKEEIKRGEIISIKFEIAYFNTITSDNFDNLFIRPLFNTIPLIPFSEAMALIKSSSNNDVVLGFQALKKYHYEIQQTWDTFLQLFRDDNYFFLHENIIDCFAFGTRNPDVFRSGTDNDIYSKRAKEVIAKLLKSDIVKLLSLVDEENHFSRGSMGEWVDFIIQTIPNYTETLLEIIDDNSFSIDIRDNAMCLIAFYNKEAFFNLQSKDELPHYKLLEREILEYGAVYPYM